MQEEMGYVDCHCHLAAPEFADDLDIVVKRGKEANIKAIIVVPEFFTEFERTLDICEQYSDFLFPCLGIHPVQRDSELTERSVMPDDLKDAIPFIDSHYNEIVGIGEVGLDFTPFYTKEIDSKEKQREVLRFQAALAQKYDLPLNVHSRSAGRPTIKALKECGATKVVLHAYSGNAASAMEGVQAGYYFSIPPCIVRSEQKQNIVKRIPMDNILLETDSPALGPEKQVRNEPSNITISCEWIAKIKGISVEDVQKITTENACKLFPKLKSVLLE
uniref:putative deoxyribonuclease TATDN3 n=1 Tax=Styela clava TaxID=7725 RepID=UPI00193A0172|nr:putative deoxyribonuclease TATDN3 [Styela clava]